jgi:hypothetical protein
LWPFLAALAALATPLAGEDDHAGSTDKDDHASSAGAEQHSIGAGVTSTYGNNPSIASSLELRTGQTKPRLEWQLEVDNHYSFDLDAEPRTVMTDDEVDGSALWRLDRLWGVGLQLKAERNRPEGPVLRASVGPSLRLCIWCGPARLAAVTVSARRELLDTGDRSVYSTTVVPATRLRLPLSRTTTIEHVLELTIPSGDLRRTRIDNEVTLTLEITGRLSAVVDVDWEHDPRPPSGGHVTLVNSLKLKLRL